MRSEPADQSRLMTAVAAELAAPVELIFKDLEAVASTFAEIVGDAVGAGGQGGGGRLVAADLVAMQPVTDRVLDSAPLFFGAGVVLSPGLLADVERHLAWRQRTPGAGHQSLLLDVDPAGEDPYDYPQMEWFRVPRDERRRMVSGPYFDFRGAGRFTLTAARPVIVAGAFAGVAGADVPLASLEADLLPVLRRVPTKVALLNHEGRVVTANTPKFTTGERLRLAEAGPQVEIVPVVADLGWSLLVVTV